MAVEILDESREVREDKNGIGEEGEVVVIDGSEAAGVRGEDDDTGIL